LFSRPVGSLNAPGAARVAQVRSARVDLRAASKLIQRLPRPRLPRLEEVCGLSEKATRGSFADEGVRP
jgi:hypothetical protein